MNLFRIFVKNNTRILLGRWEHKIPEVQKNIKFDLANIDHCGDKVCSIPKNDRLQIRNNNNRKDNKTTFKTH